MKRPKLEELSLREKVGQLLMLQDTRLAYKTVDGETDFRPQEEIDEILDNCPFGSLWKTGGIKMDIVNMAEWGSGRRMTTKESKEHIEMIQKHIRLPLLVGMDSESGLGYTFEDATLAPTALSVGAANDPALIDKLTTGIVREHKAAGSNWRWSPVVDLGCRLSPSSTIRSYSQDIDRLCELSLAAIRTAEREHLASNCKHFPGGDPYEYRDGHFAQIQQGLPLDEWKKTQGKVFQNMIDAGVMSIMTTHEAFPAVDDTMINGTILPATLSKKITTDLLRNEMGFEGVIITDGIEMASLTTICPYEEVLIGAINAGNDVLLGVRPEDFEIVYDAVVDGRIPMSRIEESCERVLAMKEKIGLFDDEAKNEVVDVKEAKKLIEEAGKEIAEKSITLLYDKINLLPVKKENIKTVGIVCISHFPGTIKQLEVMKKEFEKRGAKVTIYELVKGGGPNGIQEIVKNDLIIYAGYLAMHRPYGMMSFYGDQMVSFYHAFTQGAEKSIGLSLGYPYIHYDAMSAAKTFVNIYSPDENSQIAFVKAVYGEIPFEGVSPIDVEPKLRLIYC